MAQDDTTLGGYYRVHDRPPAYEGSDGHPYTVSVETEKTADLKAPYAGYLVFPQWAQTGVGIVGHVESPTLAEGKTAEEVTERLGELTLYEVQDLLQEAIRRSGAGGRGSPSSGATGRSDTPGEAADAGDSADADDG